MGRYGYMQHRLRKTGRVFRSEWVLVCEVKDGRILTYKMFEDTAALAAAYANVMGGWRSLPLRLIYVLSGFLAAHFRGPNPAVKKQGNRPENKG